MKFKFESRVQEVIDEIAKLPDETHDTEKVEDPLRIVGTLDSFLKANKNSPSLPSKQWVVLRRQLSFLYGLYHLALMADRTEHMVAANATKTDLLKSMRIIPTQELSKVNVYRFFVKLVKELTNGKAIADPHRVRMAANFGVLYLSDHEIQGLIDRNKV